MKGETVVRVHNDRMIVPKNRRDPGRERIREVKGDRKAFQECDRG